VRYLLAIPLSAVLVLCSCANPVNRVTSDNYAETCATAERDRRLDVAEQACYRALVNVDLGNLGPELKSQRLYNLGRIKRQLSKFGEAEDLFKQSLAIEEKISPSTDPKIGRRLIELAVSLAGQSKWAEGAQYLEKAAPISSQYARAERSFAALAFAEYAKQLRGSDPQLAVRLDGYAAALK
jgi:hypothetical protein